MKKRFDHIPLKGFRKIVEEIKNTQKQNPEPTTKPVEGWTPFFSLLAIVISGISLYFQFFYEKNDLRANFISAKFQNDTCLVSTIVYHNKGNSYATVLGNSIVFYQDSTDMDDSSYQFVNPHLVQDYRERFDPLVLSPGQQIHQELNQFFYFKNMNFTEVSINPKAKIKLALAINYINDNGYYSTNFIPVGWLTLDSTLHVDDYSVNYKSEILHSDTYFTGMSKVKK